MEEWVATPRPRSISGAEVMRDTRALGKLVDQGFNGLLFRWGDATDLAGQLHRFGGRSGPSICLSGAHRSGKEG